MADMSMPTSDDDARLDELPACHLEHADNLDIFSLSIEAL